MPATYAHNRFGEECIRLLPEKEKEICRENYDIFSFGVHGPDIFFYSLNPWKRKEIDAYGRLIHHRAGREFFDQAAKVYVMEGKKEEQLAYILGFLAHFALDSSCHRYINRMSHEPGLSHNMIESQFEAYLMKLDGRKPEKVDRSQSLNPARNIAEAIAPLFTIEKGSVLGCLIGQRFVVRCLYSPYGIKKNLIRIFLRKEIGDLNIDGESRFNHINETIYRDYQKALAEYVDIAGEFLKKADSLDNGFSSRFDMDFEGIRKNGGR